MPFIKTPILYLAICAEKNTSNQMKINVNYKIKNHVNINADTFTNEEFVNVSIKLKEAANDCENYRCAMENNDIYLLNGGIDINRANSRYQPHCHLIMEKESKIQIDSEIDTNIDLTFFLFNVLTYSDPNNNINMFGISYPPVNPQPNAVPIAQFKYDLNPKLNRDEPVENENNTINNLFSRLNNNSNASTEDSNDIDNLSLSNDEDELEVFEEPNEINYESGEEPLSEQNEINYESGEEPLSEPIHPKNQMNNFMDLNFDIISEIIENYEKSNATYKKLDEDDDNNICVVGFDKLLDGDFYYKCNECKKIIEKTNLKTWLMKQGSLSSSCPHCRYPMKVYPKLFVNKTSHSQSQ